MEEIVFQIERDDSGVLVAVWDAPGGGGITTQGRDLSELQEQVKDAVRCHFDDGEIPARIRFRFIADPVLVNSEK